MTIVHFIHGLEGSPHGNKARVLAAHFDAETLAMNTSDFEQCVALHAERLRSRPPDVVIGSSFGGAVAVALLQIGAWTGPTLLLAQAALRRGLPPDLPVGVRVWLVHGTGDDVISIEDSRLIAQANRRPEVRLVEVDDDHSLHESTANGALVAWVRDITRPENS